MDFDSEISLDHLLFTERKCRVCGETKDLVQEFYVTRKNRTHHTLMNVRIVQRKE